MRSFCLLQSPFLLWLADAVAHSNHLALTSPACLPFCSPSVTFYSSGWLALWSSIYGVWSGVFYARNGRFIYPFLGAAIVGFSWMVAQAQCLAALSLSL